MPHSIGGSPDKKKKFGKGESKLNKKDKPSKMEETNQKLLEKNLKAVEEVEEEGPRWFDSDDST